MKDASGPTRHEIVVWTTWKPHSPWLSCGPLKWHPTLEAKETRQVEVETPKRGLNCRLRLKNDTEDAQLQRTARKASKWLKKVRSATVLHFFERPVVELEKQLCMENQHGFLQNIKSVQLEETKKIDSQYVRYEEERLLRDECCIRERWIRFIPSLLNANSDMLDSNILKKLSQQPVASALGIEPT